MKLSKDEIVIKGIQSITDRAYTTLENAILSGKLKPGDKIVEKVLITFKNEVICLTDDLL